MKQATMGDTVRIHFRTLKEDGVEVGSSAAAGGPVDISLGNGQIFAKLEQAMEGMTEGETRSVTLQPEETFGPHQDHLVQVVEREAIPPEIDLQVGTGLTSRDSEGKDLQLVVVALDDATVTLDANHPLAGQVLTFELTLVEFAA